ncbi:MAG: arsenate reductase [Rhodobacterales bacterium]|nr:MAG: arsenate reductase [Rhodobacterales bacterium]
MRVYGIKNCDTVRKAMRALEAAGRGPELVDIRATPLTQAEITRFLDAFGPALINKRSTTWRGLSEEERAGDPATLLAAHPTLMKRPVIEEGGRMTLGWDKTAQGMWT